MPVHSFSGLLLLAVMAAHTTIWVSAYVLRPISTRSVSSQWTRTWFGSTGALCASRENIVNRDNSNTNSDINWDWKQVSKDVFQADKRPIVLFDGVCNLCDAGINFAMDQDQTAKLRFCSLQSKVAQSLLLREGKPIDHSQICYVTHDTAYFSSDAVSHICMELDALPLQWFGKLGQCTPPWIRESTFQFVSSNRDQFGENDSCRMDYDGTFTTRFVSDPLDIGENNSNI